MKTFVGDFLVRPHCLKTPPGALKVFHPGRDNKKE